MRIAAAALVLAVTLVAVATVAQDTAEQNPADRVIEVAQDAQQTRQQTQDRLDDWAAERAALQQRWEAAEAQVAYLEQRAQLERDRLAALESAGDELARRLDESQRLEASLEDTLLAVLGRLERAVANDLPFLPEERSRRLETVRRELGDPAASPADKLRRVLEAVLIETRYGGALEVYQDRITLDGQAGDAIGDATGGDEELSVDVLTVGRLGLFWLTPDMRRGGRWDPAGQAYVELDGDALEAIRRAVEMATRRRPVGVQELPLGKVGS
jgi:uncharacterized protein YukE